MPPTNIVLDSGSKEKWIKFPYEIVDVDGKINEKLLEDFTGEKTGFVQVGPKKYFFPYKYRNAAEHIYNLKPRQDDVWVVTFPRSGTTWTQEMVWLLANDLDYQKASETPLLARFPFLEYSMFVHKDIKAQLLEENKGDIIKTKIVQDMDTPMWDEMEKMTSRRFIKTHMPFSLLPPNLLESGCKVIYVARNPKDVALSYFHLNRTMRTQGYQNNWPTYWNYFENGLQAWSPYWEHIKEAWNLKDNPNLLFLFYEDLNKDLRTGVKKISAFLNKTISESDLDILQDHLHISNFRKNPSVNFDLLTSVGVTLKGEEAFVRQGKSGNWKCHYDDVLNARANKWIDANMAGCDIKFPEVS